jgi:WD40 repeat protein
MRVYTGHVTALLLCFCLVSCVSATSTSNNVTASPTSQTEVVPHEANAQVPEVNVTKLNEWRYLDQYVNGINWAPSSDQFTVSLFDIVRLFEVNTFQEVWNIPSLAPAYNAGAPVFSPNGKLLYLYVRLKGLQMYDVQTGDLLKEAVPDYQSLCHPNDANGAVISIDGQTLFVSVDDNRKKQVDFMEIQSWDVLTLQCEVLFRLEGHSRSIDISSDGRYLSASTGKGTSISNGSLSEDGGIIVWDVESKEQACFIKNKGSFARFKPLVSELLIADPSQDKLSYWDITTCSLDHEIEGITTYYDFVFSPDGKMIALWDGVSISILDAGSGALLQRMNDPSLENTPINYLQSYLAFSPDGYYLLSVLNRDPLESLIILWGVEK